MSCDDIRALLPGWADQDQGGLSDEERRRVATHLETCPDCQRLLKELEESLSLVRRLPRIAAPPRVQDRALNLGRRHARQMEMETTALGGPVAAARLSPPKAAASMSMLRDKSTHGDLAPARREAPVPASVPVEELASRRGTKWLFVIVVVAVIAVLVYWLLR